jgi:hypothetical protein
LTTKPNNPFATISPFGSLICPDPISALAWIRELESGRYRQTRKVLHDQNGYCCLGVAADTLRPERWTDHLISTGAVEDGDPVGYGFLIYDDELGEQTVETAIDMPDELRDVLGIDEQGAADIEIDGEQIRLIWNIGIGYESLAKANDDGATFQEIANALRWAYGFPALDS